MTPFARLQAPKKYADFSTDTKAKVQGANKFSESF
jgi:hypothetical protein